MNLKKYSERIFLSFGTRTEIIIPPYFWLIKQNRCRIQKKNQKSTTGSHKILHGFEMKNFFFLYFEANFSFFWYTNRNYYFTVIVAYYAVPMEWYLEQLVRQNCVALSVD